MSRWNPESLKEYTDVRLREVERRLAEGNQMREQMGAQKNQFVERELYDERHELLKNQVSTLSQAVARLEGGRALRASTVGWALAGLGLIISVVVVIVNIATSGTP